MSSLAFDNLSCTNLNFNHSSDQDFLRDVFLARLADWTLMQLKT